MNAWPIRILHLGLGRFHRAHQAVYYQNLYEQFGQKWGVASFSMRSPEARDEMRRAHNHYPVVQFSKDETKLQWVDAIRSSYFVQDDHHEFLKIFASPELTLVTLTVTEKAYQGTDLYDLLYEGLQTRHATGRPLTILSCDNVQDNGAKLQAGVLKSAETAGHAAMINWIKNSVAFPNSMVDRIVPALTPDRLKELQTQFKTDSPELLATEIFSQWVIEDRFASPRPPLKDVGAQIVSDVKPFEVMKLRLLNASHSLIAYAGLLKGYRFVHEAIRDHEIRDRVTRLYQEVRPLLKAPDGFNLESYCTRLLERFDNENLPHQLQQIAMDGSEKLKQRIVPSLKSARERGGGHDRELRAVIETWARYCEANVPDDPARAKIESLKSRRLPLPEFINELQALIGANEFSS